MRALGPSNQTMHYTRDRRVRPGGQGIDHVIQTDNGQHRFERRYTEIAESGQYSLSQTPVVNMRKGGCKDSIPDTPETTGIREITTPLPIRTDTDCVTPRLIGTPRTILVNRTKPLGTVPTFPYTEVAVGKPACFTHIHFACRLALIHSAKLERSPDTSTRDKTRVDLHGRSESLL